MYLSNWEEEGRRNGREAGRKRGVRRERGGRRKRGREERVEETGAKEEERR